MDSQRAGGTGRSRAGLDGVHVQGEIRIFVLGLLSTLSLTLSLSLSVLSFLSFLTDGSARVCVSMRLRLRSSCSSPNGRFDSS